MKTQMNSRSQRVLILASFVALAGCVVGGGGYDGGASVGYDVGFYEPFGYDYGGWGPGYGVGVPRRGYDRGRPERPERPDGHAAPHPSYRPAAPSRSMPSLPSRSRGR